MMYRYIYELVTGNKTQSIKNVSHVSVVSLYCKTRTYLCSDEHSEGEHNRMYVHLPWCCVSQTVK